MATVGYVTTYNKIVCLACVDYCDNSSIGRVDYPDRTNRPIEDPAPDGVFNARARNHQHYDAPCELCGSPLRRSRAPGRIVVTGPRA